jgi:hypothetical protein
MNRSKYEVVFLVELHVVKAYWGTWIYTHRFLTFAVDKDECLALSCSRSISGKYFLYVFIRSLGWDLQLL